MAGTLTSIRLDTHLADEAAKVLGLTERTLHRHWRFIKAWLKSRLGEPG